MHTVIGLGELLWDIFEDCKVLGGAPANFAYHVHCLRRTGLPFSRVGSDELGDELLASLSSRELCTDFIQRDRQHPTGKVFVELDEEGVPAFEIQDDVAWDYMKVERRWLDAARGADAICFGTLCQRSEKSRKTIRRILEEGKDSIRVLDLNLRKNCFNREIISGSLERCDILKLNVYEYSTLQELYNRPCGEGEFAECLRNRHGMDLVCVTHGEEGCRLYSNGGEVRGEAVEVDVADTVGAGDAFCAAMTVNYLRGENLQKVADSANRLAAYVASHRGAMPHIPERIIEEIL
ncbi:MAG: carbohydrate kinase family protein [Planctomycetota bacterium]